MTTGPTALDPEEGAGAHPELERWLANVGPPVSLDLASPRTVPLRGLTVLCWNLAIGRARLHALLRRLRAARLGAVFPTGGEAGAGGDSSDDGALLDEAWPLVILAQEAFRTGDAVPARCVGRCHGGRMLTRRRADITEIAEAEGLSLRYAPSMRNGPDRSDRGNAVLSSIPIRQARSLLLPYVRQRRVAVAAALDGVPDLHVASAHLDTGGQARRAEERVPGLGGGRAAQAAALGRQVDLLAGPDGSVVLGADLNTAFGMRDPALVALVRSGLHIASRRGSWWHTYHGAIPLLLDHVLFRSVHRRIESVCVTRLDEAPADRSRGVFGSDHHPLLARVEFGAPDHAVPGGRL